MFSIIIFDNKERFMELRNIISFLKVNELSSFSKAAEVLGYTQSNISSHISQLEKELNHPLFERFGKNIYLTEYGKTFLPYALEITNTVEQAKLTLCDDCSSIKELRIGILESLCTTYMPNLVTDFHKIYPGINIIIKIGTFQELSNMLNTHQIDLLWTFDYQFDTDMWIKALEHEEHIYVITASKDSLNDKKNYTLDALQNSNFIFTEQNCSYRNLFENILKKNNIAYTIFMEIGNTEIIKKFVNSGLCLSVLPEFAIQKDLENNTLQILPIADVSLTMYSQIFYHKNKFISPCMKDFLTLLKKYFVTV